MTLFTMIVYFFFFNDTATTEIYTLSLHDALPILLQGVPAYKFVNVCLIDHIQGLIVLPNCHLEKDALLPSRSEEHTSELQSRQYLVCRLLLEKKKKKHTITH